MKKVLIAVLAVVLVAMVFVGCNPDGTITLEDGNDYTLGQWSKNVVINALDWYIDNRSIIYYDPELFPEQNGADAFPEELTQWRPDTQPVRGA